MAAFFRRIQSVFDPYRSNQNAPTTVDPATGQVTGSAQFTSPFFLPQWYTITAPAGGTASIDKNGQFVYTPTAAARHAAATPGAASTDSFTVTANNWISKSSVVVTVPVVPTNSAPVAGTTTVGTPGANGVVAGSVAVTDADRDSISYVASVPTKGTVAMSGSGAFTYTPTAAARHDAAATTASTAARSDGFTITASDGHGGATPISVVVPILPANQAPIAGTTTVGTPGTDGVVNGSVSTTDADKDTVTYSGTSAPSRGSVVVTSTGGFTYTPTSTAQHAASLPGGVTTDSFTVTANDGHGGVVPISVVVPISSANRAPVAGTTTLDPTAPNGFLGGTVTATDPDGDTVTFSGPATSVGGGTVQVSGSGQFIFQPTGQQQHAASATGGATTDSFTITASDGHGGATPISVVVPILPANTPPVAGTTVIGTPGVNGVVTGTVAATDADNDTVNYTAGTGSGAPTQGAVVVTSAGGFTYTPAAGAGANGASSDTFTVIASDGHGGAIPISVVVPIAAANHPPVAGTTTVGTAGVGGLVTGTVSATDLDNDTVTFTAPAGGLSTRGGTVTVTSSGEFRYTPSPAAQHDAASYKAGLNDTFTITASDGRGGSTSITVTVPIAPVNTAPAAGTPTATVVSSETGQVTGSINAVDADGDRLTYSTSRNSTTSAGGSITVLSDGTYSYIPTAASRHAAAAPGGVSLDSFTVTVTDGHRGSSDVTFSLPIYSANQAPTGGAVTVDPVGINGVVTGRVTFTDPDGDGLTYTALQTSRGGTVVIASDGSFTYTPTSAAAHAAAAGGPNVDGFGVSANDGHGGTTAPVTVVVPITTQNNKPAVPTGQSGALITNIDQTTSVATGRINATDADGDTLTYTAATPGKGTVIVNPDGTFTYTPSAAARHAVGAQGAPAGANEDSFIVTVTDGHGGELPITVTVPAIFPANNPPVPGTPVVGTADPTTGVITGRVTATDADNDVLAYYPGSAPVSGVVVVNSDGTFTYTPNTPPSSTSPTSDSFSVYVVDGHGAPVTVTVPITLPRTGGTTSSSNPTSAAFTGTNPGTGQFGFVPPPSAPVIVPNGPGSMYTPPPPLNLPPSSSGGSSQTSSGGSTPPGKQVFCGNTPTGGIDCEVR
ncbi:Ig-like domain-containing protein [Williamsia sp. M5A3_1d]